VLNDDTDGNGDGLMAVLNNGPANGIVTLYSTGAFTYSPTADFYGSDTFSYKANDGLLNSNIATVTIAVTNVNDPPVAEDDAVSTPEDTPLLIAETVLLANDVNLDPDTLSVNAVNNPTNGAVALAAGTITFTPTADFHGTAGFDYTVSDGTLTDNGHVVVTVSSLNDAPVAVNDTASTNEDTSINILDSTLLGNDTDVELDPLTVTAVGNPTNGTVALDAGTITFTPARNFHGTAGFDYVVSDGTATDTGHVTITVAPVNDAPVAVDDTASTDEETPVDISVGTLLVNDTDVDGDTLTLVELNNATNGTLALVGETITFTPAANFNGEAGFGYTITDGTATDMGHVIITVVPVNDAPVAVDDTVEADEDTPVLIPVSTLLANDTDVDLDTLTVTGVSDPSNGTVALAAGTITFTPALEFNGEAGFDYTITDGTATATAHVTITVGPINDTPVAVDDMAATNEDTAVEILVSTLLANDTDADGDILTLVELNNATNGTLALVGETITFTPVLNFNGEAGFDYTITDGTATDTAHVTISVAAVNDAPVAVSDTATTNEDTAVEILDSTLLANDADVDLDTLLVTGVSNPIHGTVVLAAGTITFTPAANFNGNAGFDYTISDGAETDMAHVTITVAPVNDAPVAVDDTAATDEDTPVDIFVGTLLTNDIDVDGDTLSLTGVSNATGGTVALVAGIITFTPAANFNGEAGFDYTITDGAATATAHVVVTVDAVNDAPMAADDNFTMDEDTVLNDTLSATDVDGDDLTFSGSGDTAHGAVVINTDGTFTYTPDANYFGTDSFEFTVSDGELSDIGTITITITDIPDNAAPVAGDDAYEMDEDTVLNIAAPGVLNNDSDADEDPITAVLVTGPTHGILVLNADGSFTYTPAPDFFGTDSFTYVANDGTADSNVATVTLTVVDMPEIKTIRLPIILK